MDDLRHVHFAGTEPAARPAVEPPPPDPFLEELLRGAGLDPEAYRPRALQRRLPACLRQLRVRTTDEARALLRRDPRLRASALDARWRSHVTRQPR